jgi:WASH complex subunit 7
MVKAFSKIVTSESKHLKLFYLLVPALSINYVEYVTRGKDQINKKITTKAFIYDDGFVLGVAYFLTLLRQKEHYKTLHWDTAASFYCTETRKESKAANVDTANHSAKFIEDLNIQKQLLVKKIESMDEEYAFFNYNLISAKILFKSKTESSDIPRSPPSGNETQ